MSNRRPDSSYNLCTFTFANGKCCGMPAHPKHDGLCLNHATVHRRTYQREDDLLKELASPAGDFITQIDINYVLGKLFEALAANRVSPRRAATLAYIGHLLLRSQQGARHEAEFWDQNADVFRRLVKIKYPLAQSPKSLVPAGPASAANSANAADSEQPFTLPLKPPPKPRLP